MTPSVRAAIKNNNTGEIYQMMAESGDLGMITLEQDLKRLYMAEEDLAGERAGAREQQAALPADPEHVADGRLSGARGIHNGKMTYSWRRRKDAARPYSGLFVDGLDVKLAHLSVQRQAHRHRGTEVRDAGDQAPRSQAGGGGDGRSGRRQRRRSACPRRPPPEAAVGDGRGRQQCRSSRPDCQLSAQQVLADLQPRRALDLLPQFWRAISG